MTSSAIAELLNRDDVRGRIIKDAAIIESEMGVVIAFYFTTNKRFGPFYDLIIDRLGFNDKIAILEKIPYSKRYVSLKSFAHVRQLQQVRNYVAHNYYIQHTDKKVASASWKPLFSNYPKSYDSAIQAARRGIGRLTRTNEFLDHFAPARRGAT
ncbi:MAG: hypothetical protein J0I74_12390 [Rhodanobacter sp.]|nr:hypothetical protein [Rhodanobacter sp.]